MRPRVPLAGRRYGREPDVPAHLAQLEHHPITPGTTLDGPTAVALASIGPLRAGRASIPRVDAAILGEAARRRTEDGLLPTALFQGIYFDNRAGTVVLNPRRAVLSSFR